MSTISDALAEILTNIASSLTGGNYVRLTDVVNIENNSLHFLKKGYGISIGPMINPQRELCSRLYIKRDISVILTNEIIARELDASSRFDAQASLIADMDDVLISLHQLGLATSNVVNHLVVNEASGVDEILVDKTNFVSCTATITLEYKKE